MFVDPDGCAILPRLDIALDEDSLSFQHYGEDIDDVDLWIVLILYEATEHAFGCFLFECFLWRRRGHMEHALPCAGRSRISLVVGPTFGAEVCSGVAFL
jgi:hypothetical protein